jgi:hypothetical protein
MHIVSVYSSYTVLHDRLQSTLCVLYTLELVLPLYNDLVLVVLAVVTFFLPAALSSAILLLILSIISAL